jgi:uncharacterized protein
MKGDLSSLHRAAQQLVSTLTEGGDPASPIAQRALFMKLLEQHIAILGKTGSGKSYCAKGIAERLLAEGKRVCIVDPTGVWWGLRCDSTGRGMGFPVVLFGGDHGPGPNFRPSGDFNLNHEHGQLIAELVGTTNTSAVLDTRNLTIKQRTKFFTDFAETLLRVNRGPLALILDEAHLYCPQARPSDAGGGRMLDAANNLVSLGRGIGLRIILISQRPAKISKDSLTQAESLIVLRLIAPHDRRAVEDWIGEWCDVDEGREVLKSLQSLPTGEGWVWAPELGVLEYTRFPRIKTYDSSRAPDGTRRVTKLPPPNLILQSQIAGFRAKLENGADS